MPEPEGKRRIDRVLADEYLFDVSDMPLDEVRAVRSEAQQEEADLSYIRRLIQARIDIIDAELHRRETGTEHSLVEDLARILADGPRQVSPGLARVVSAEPSRIAEHRRYAERLVADVQLSALGDRTDDELRRARAELADQEAEVSEQRHRVQAVVDRCGAELTRRYRDGEAQVADLLAEQ